MADNTTTLHNFFLTQLSCWPLAANNYAALAKVETRQLLVDGFPITLQHNPGRVRSTAAKVSAEEVSKRPCFLCSSNRPKEQRSLSFSASVDYDILVNPFPIADEHYTIAATGHLHQDLLHPGDMERFVTEYPDYLAFYNGSTAGASAPDHLHFQACRKDFLSNLVNYAECGGGQLIKRFTGVDIWGMPEMPMQVVHFVSDVVSAEMELWLKSLVPQQQMDMSPMIGMRNILMWRDSQHRLHTLLFPRAAHRPECYFAKGEENCMVSPGALDMAGVIILPRAEDFRRLTSLRLRNIYDEVSLDYRALPAFQHLLLI